MWEAELESAALVSGELLSEGLVSAGLAFDGDDEADPADVPPAAAAGDWAMAAPTPSAAIAAMVMRFFMGPPDGRWC